MPKLQISTMIIPNNGMNGISTMKGVSMNNSPSPKIHTKQNVSPSGINSSPLDLIQELLQDEFTCPVCYQPCRNTYINTTCNRRYCSSCIGEGISKCNTECATCSKIVPANTQENTVKRDLSADRVVSALCFSIFKKASNQIGVDSLIYHFLFVTDCRFVESY